MDLRGHCDFFLQVLFQQGQGLRNIGLLARSDQGGIGRDLEMLEDQPAQLPISMVSELTRAEIMQQEARADMKPRSPAKAARNIMSLATMSERAAQECGCFMTGASARYLRNNLSRKLNMGKFCTADMKKAPCGASFK